VEGGGRDEGFPGAGFGADAAVAFSGFGGGGGGGGGAAATAAAAGFRLVVGVVVGIGGLLLFEVEVDRVGYEAAVAASGVGFWGHSLLLFCVDLLFQLLGSCEGSVRGGEEVEWWWATVHVYYMSSSHQAGQYM